MMTWTVPCLTETIILWMISILFGYLIFSVVRSFLTPRWKHPVSTAFSVLLLFSSANIVVYPEELTGTVGFFFCFILIIFLLFKNEWYLKLSAAILIFPVVVSINYITQDIGHLIWVYAFDRTPSSIVQTVLHTTTLALRLPIWYLLYRLVKHWLSYTVKLLLPRMWIVLDLVALTSFTGIITVIKNTETAHSYTAYPACVACVFTTLGCCYLCTYMAKTVRSDMALETFQYQQSYYQELEQNQQTVRRLRHDMKNHLNIIGTFLRDNEIEQAKEYFQELNQEFASNLKVYCPNKIVNAVLNSKEQLALDSNIQCDFQIDLETSPKIDDIDLCSILGNTIDNAIEALGKVPELSERTLSLKARYTNHFFSYEIKNTKINEIQKKGGRFLTDKIEKEAHGIGLRSVQTIVEKYNGDMDISYTNDTFTVTIMIQG